mmetsp:Transcript_10520/g.13787  ORF Transcript_10520/g.13787 Transcript_10520/m.13787 type:complete len:123 (+) Transcript_10520:716-1084(+)
MAEHMNDLLLKNKLKGNEKERTGYPLSFTVIVPCRYDNPICSRIDQEFFVHKLTLDNRSHSYTYGAQQKRRKLSVTNSEKTKNHMKSTCDTSILIFQSTAARKKWKVRKSFDKRLSLAFSAT